VAIKSNSSGLPSPSKQKAALDAAKKPATPTPAPAPTQAFNQTLNLYGTPNAPTATADSSNKPSASKPAATPKPAAAPAPTSTAAQDALDAINKLSETVSNVDKGFVRNAAAEAAAIAAGTATKEEIEARGGVNASGYFGDSYNPNTSLTDAEYAEAAKGGGAAINAAIEAKTAAYNKAIGGSTSGTTSGTSTTIDKNTRDAYAILEDTFKSYGLDSLVPVIRGYMESNLGAEQAKLQLKQEPVYKARFAGNTARVAAGLNALSEADYLGLEDYYSETMNQYGLGSYFGATRDARIKAMADIIGGDVSATEFKERVSTVVDRVNNADENIKTQLKSFYNISDTDLVKYFLNPAQTLPELQQKVTSAEIGTAAIEQGLKTSMASAEDLAKYGVNRATAIKGYATIGSVLPESQKLSDIYNEADINYTQGTAEEEVFKGSASAARKRKQLAQLEQASFKGQSGVSQYGLSKSIQGSF
jgi:hypothetical protein